MIKETCDANKVTHLSLSLVFGQIILMFSRGPIILAEPLSLACFHKIILFNKNSKEIADFQVLIYFNIQYILWGVLTVLSMCVIVKFLWELFWPFFFIFSNPSEVKRWTGTTVRRASGQLLSPLHNCTWCTVCLLLSRLVNIVLLSSFCSQDSALSWFRFSMITTMGFRRECRPTHWC